MNFKKILICTLLIANLSQIQIFAQEGGKITFRKDGIMMIDNKPFFPIGAYRDPNDNLDDFSTLKKAGFNMTHDYWFEHTNIPIDKLVKSAKQYLQAAHKSGLSVFLGIPRRAIKHQNYDGIKRYVSELKNMPALNCWYLYDEPIAQKIPSNILDKAANVIRNIDPVHPLAMVFNHIRTGKGRSSAKIKEYTDIVDIVWVDPYPIGSKSKDHIRCVGQNISIAYSVSENQKPVWSVIQAFQWEYYRNEKTIKKDGPPNVPNKQQFRYMNYLALASGAKGLIYYWGNKKVYHIVKDAPQVWTAICEVVEELNTLRPFLTAYADKKSPYVPSGFKLWTRKIGKKRVFAIINFHNKSQQFKWSLPWKNGGILKSFPDNKKISLVNDKFYIKFNPLEVKVFIINNE